MRDFVFIISFLFFQVPLVAPGAVALEGKWSTDCFSKKVGDQTVSIKNRAEFIANTVTTQIKFCEIEQGSTQVLKSNFEIAEDFPAFENVRAMDFTVIEFYIGVHNQYEAALMNQANWCGFTDWAVGITKSILGTVCDSRQLSQGQKLRHIFAMDGDGKLYMDVLGTARNEKGLFPDPTKDELDLLNPFKRVNAF